MNRFGILSLFGWMFMGIGANASICSMDSCHYSREVGGNLLKVCSLKPTCHGNGHEGPRECGEPYQCKCTYTEVEKCPAAPIPSPTPDDCDHCG